MKKKGKPGLAFITACSFWYEWIAKRITKVSNVTNELFNKKKFGMEQERNFCSDSFLFVRSSSSTPVISAHSESDIRM